MTYYIERNLMFDNSWRMVAIENEEKEAIKLMISLAKKSPNNRYRVVKYIDSRHINK